VSLFNTQVDIPVVLPAINELCNCCLEQGGGMADFSTASSFFSQYPFENGNKFIVTPDGKGVSAPMMMLGFGGAANDKNCWKMNLLPFSKGYLGPVPFSFLFSLERYLIVLKVHFVGLHVCLSVGKCQKCFSSKCFIQSA